MSDCSATNVKTVTGNDSFINEGQMVSWAEYYDGLVDSFLLLLGQRRRCGNLMRGR